MAFEFVKDKNTIKEHILKQCKDSSIGDCIEWTGTNQNGYGVINLKVFIDNGCIWKRFYTHRIMFMLENGHYIKEHYEVSHLCHNRLCLKTVHLCMEPPAVNKQRESCLVLGKCIGHGKNPSCML